MLLSYSKIFFFSNRENLPKDNLFFRGDEPDQNFFIKLFFKYQILFGTFYYIYSYEMSKKIKLLKIKNQPINVSKSK